MATREKCYCFHHQNDSGGRVPERELSPDVEDASAGRSSVILHTEGSTAIFIFSLKTEHLNEPEADPYLYLGCLVLLTFLFSMPHTWLF